MFLILKELVQRDVEAIKGHGHAAFEVKPGSSENVFLVVKTWDAGGIQSAEATTFEYVPHESRLLVKDARSGRELFSGVPRLDTDGVCRFRVNDKFLDLWEVAEKALEKLFFG
jgi:hypothetical protein